MGNRDRKPRVTLPTYPDAVDKAVRTEARAIVERWNAEARSREYPLWSPSIRCALVAGYPWLEIGCPGCGTSRSIDLRDLDRHPEASIASLLIGLKCSWCRGRAPMPRLLGLYEWPYVVPRKETL